MASYQRATVPEEFYDKTSDLLLRQPEPQYLYAQLFLGALGMSLGTPPELGLPGRAISGVGAGYTALETEQLVLANPMFTDIIAAKVDFNAMPGQTIRINRPVYTNTTYTEASRRIVSGSTISTTGVTISSQQNNLTLFTYGGPYDQTNSRVAPYSIQAFDANMGVHNTVQIHGTQLKRDFHRFIDAVQVTLLDLAANTLYPEGMTADNDATVAGAFPFTFELITRTESAMDNANLPTFADGFRVLVLSPNQVQQLQLDADFQRAGWMFPEYNVLFPQYVKSIGKFHIFKSTTLTAKANSSSVNIDYGHAIAPGTLLAGMGREVRVMPNTNDNYGETVLVIWRGDLAFGLSNSSFVYSVRSSE